jgi:hypothetical protein
VESVNSRGHFGLKKNDLAKVTSWMVVVYFCLFIIVRYSTCGFIFIKNPYLRDRKGYSTGNWCFRSKRWRRLESMDCRLA